MPTKRSKRTRVRRDLSADELQWLTGREQPGTTALWRFRQWIPERLEHCKQLLQTHAHLIPDGRMPELQRDIERWSPIVDQ